MTERIPCISIDCTATILPTTAAKTGGYCMPCYQAIEREAHMRYVEENRRTVDLYEGVTNPVEILKIMYTPRTYDELIKYVPYPLTEEQLYLQLDQCQMKEMEQYAKEKWLLGDEHLGWKIVLSLSCYRDYIISDQMLKLVLQGSYNAAILFRNAPDSIRNQVLAQIEVDKNKRQTLLLALTWIGDDQVVQQFNEWRLSPPSWANEMYIPVEKFSYEAGWELTAEGKRQDLFLPVNYGIEYRNDHNENNVERQEYDHFHNNDHVEFKLLAPSKHTCAWCGGELTKLIKLGSQHASVKELGWPYPYITIETCLNCSAYGEIFMEMNENGEGIWSKYNRKPSYLPELDEEATTFTLKETFKLAQQPRALYHSAEWMLEGTNSQIGGHPGWIQDAYFPTCPCCSKKMIFIAQVDFEHVTDSYEGIYYMFACSEDQITTTLFQQT